MESPSVPSSKPKPWSPAEDERLRALVLGGATFVEAGIEIGRHPGSTAKRAKALGLRTDAAIAWATRERIVELLAEGWRPSRIAAQVGASVETVQRVGGLS